MAQREELKRDESGLAQLILLSSLTKLLVRQGVISKEHLTGEIASFATGDMVTTETKAEVVKIIGDIERW